MIRVCWRMQPRSLPQGTGKWMPIHPCHRRIGRGIGIGAPNTFRVSDHGIAGAVGGFLLLYYISVVYYPINVGGRPLNSWPAYIPISFELTVLSAGTIGFLALLIINRLPMPYHPVFNSASFAKHASNDRFYLCIEADDPLFDPDRTRDFLMGLNPMGVIELEK